jgi:hypothetical protein
MPYELVELSTGNMVGYFDTEQAALRDVAESIERYGMQSVETLALGFDEPNGAGRAIAKGKALAKLARERVQPVTASEGDGRTTRDVRGGQTRARSSATGRFVEKSVATRRAETKVLERTKKK